MKKHQKENPRIKFSAPDPETNIVSVSRVLPDKSTEPIGKITPDFSNEDGSTIYISTNIQGEEIFPPTTDFIETEKQFEKHIEMLSQKSFTEDMTERAYEYEKREQTIRGLRLWKLKPKLINR